MALAFTLTNLEQYARGIAGAIASCVGVPGRHEKPDAVILLTLTPGIILMAGLEDITIPEGRPFVPFSMGLDGYDGSMRALESARG